MNFTESLYEEMEERLREAVLVSDNLLQRAQRSIIVVRTALQQLKANVLEEGFADHAEEIRFFKEIKPRFLKQMIFFQELFVFEEKRPVGVKEELLAYYREAIIHISLFFSRHEEIRNYYRLGRNDQDEQFFTRAAGYPDESPEFDSRFSTKASYQRGKILAFEAFLAQLIKELHELEHGTAPAEIADKTSPRLVWTDTKVAFIEWIYGLQASGSVNGGKISVALLMEIMGLFFQIDPGNFYAVFQQNIRIRKKSRTAYLDFQTERLESRMNESDENPRYK